MGPRAFTTALAIALPLMAAPVAPAQDDDQQARPRTSQSREAMRFQGMDSNRDGVITRREWRGSDTSFRTQDWNGDLEARRPHVWRTKARGRSISRASIT